MSQLGNRRKRRTRNALIDAFNQIVLNGNDPKPRVADVVERANVGRSTFYEHYTGIDHIYLHALSRPLAVLADAAAGKGDAARLTSLLEHFLENREHARSAFVGDLRDKVTRLLAQMVAERMLDERHCDDVPKRLVSLQRAETALAPIRGWLLGEASCEPSMLAAWICRSAAP